MQRFLKFFLLGAALCTSWTALGKVQNAASYGDWRGVCQQDPKSQQEICGLEQFTYDQQQPVGRILLRHLLEQASQQHEVFAFLTLPLGVDLPQGVLIEVDGEKIGVAKFDFCDPGGCHAIFMVDQPLMQAVKKGKQLRTTVFLLGQSKAVSFSLMGLTKALTALE